MKSQFFQLTLILALFTLANAAQAITPSDIPLCNELLKQVSGNKKKKDDMESALHITAKYPHILGALNRLQKSTNGDVCGKAVVIGVNANFPGGSKYIYFFRFEVSYRGELKAVVPVLMFDTSVQGHENGRNAFALSNSQVISVLKNLIDKNPLEKNIESQTKPVSPGFISSLKKTSLGQPMVRPNAAFVMSLDRMGHYLLTGFKELTTIHGSKVTVPFGALLSAQTGSSKLRYNDSLSNASELVSPLSDLAIDESRPNDVDQEIELIVRDSFDLF